MRRLVWTLARLGGISAPRSVQSGESYDRATRGTRILEGQNGFAIKVLVEQANLGGTEVEIGEMEHIVNGHSYVLTPGMVGIVRPGDNVIHKINLREGVRSVVIWAPGGEAERLAQFFTSKPIAP